MVYIIQAVLGLTSNLNQREEILLYHDLFGKPDCAFETDLHLLNHLQKCVY